MQYILENPFVIFAIIAMIASFFKKMKQSNPEDPKKEPEWKKLIKIPRTVEESRPEISSSNSYQTPQDRKIAQEYYDMKEKSERTALKEKNVNSRKDTHRNERIQKAIVITEIEEHLDLSPKRENVIEGIVWSEILAPPRAFKSHSSRRATSRR